MAAAAWNIVDLKILKFPIFRLLCENAVVGLNETVVIVDTLRIHTDQASVRMSATE